MKKTWTIFRRPRIGLEDHRRDNRHEKQNDPNINQDQPDRNQPILKIMNLSDVDSNKGES